MGRYWLHDMPRWLAEDPRLRVRLWPGWETRSRSTGGFDAILAVVDHHTASSPSMSTTAHCRALWETSASRPVGNFYLARDGEVCFGAAGASNCQGKGGPIKTSKGTVPLDQGNRYMVAIEAGNNGVGEPWPAEQLAAYVRLVSCLVRNLALLVGDVHTHNSYVRPSCPGRKIDPAGPTASVPVLGGVTGAKTWAVEDVRRWVQAEIDAWFDPLRAPYGPLFEGSKAAPEIARLTQWLTVFGMMPGPATLDYTAAVADAVRKLQGLCGLPVTGVYADPEAGAISAINAWCRGAAAA